MTSLSVDTMRNDIEEIIRRIQPKFAGTISDTDRLREDLGLDSLHAMELLSAITEQYEIDVDIEEVQEIRTIGDVLEFLSKAMSKAS